MSHIYKDEAMQEKLNELYDVSSELAYLLENSDEEDKLQAYARVIDKVTQEFDNLRPSTPL